MKKSAFAILLIVLAVSVSQLSAQVRFGVKAGLNLSNISQQFKESDYEMTTHFLPAFHVGLVADVPFSGQFSFQPGVLFSVKGYSMDVQEMLEDFYGEDLPDGFESDGYARTKFNYIEIPLNLAFKANDFQIAAGPYVALGISGKQKWDYSMSYMGFSDSDNGTLTLKPYFGEVKDSDLGEDEDAFSAIDYGVNFSVGYMAGPVLIQGGYALGLGNLTPLYEGMTSSDRADYKMSNRVITFSVSYFFGE